MVELRGFAKPYTGDGVVVISKEEAKAQTDYVPIPHAPGYQPNRRASHQVQVIQDEARQEAAEGVRRAMIKFNAAVDNATSKFGITVGVRVQSERERRPYHLQLTDLELLYAPPVVTYTTRRY